MTDQTTALALLRDAEHYLSALHGSVARHDHLAANLACAGCELRDRIGAALPELAAVLPATTDQTAAPSADRAARWEQAAWAAGRTVDRNALAVYMAVADQEQAAALRVAADAMDEHCHKYGVFGVGDRLRRMADETQPAETDGLSPLEAAARTVELDRDAASSGESRDYRRGMTRAVQVLRLLDGPEPAAGARQDGAQR